MNYRKLLLFSAMGLVLAAPSLAVAIADPPATVPAVATPVAAPDKPDAKPEEKPVEPVIIPPVIVAPPPPIPYTIAPPMPVVATKSFDVKLVGKTAVHVVGSIGSGATARLRDVLAKNPLAKTVILSSPGGLVIEGMAMGEVIRKNAMNTHVEAFCASACTFAFIAGADRSLAPQALVGFHRASKGGPANLNKPNDEGETLANDVTRQVYQSANIAPEIIDRALTTSSDDMWFPDHRLLISSRVATRDALPKEFEVQAASWKSFGELEAALGGDPLWQAVKRAKPQYYAQALAAAWFSASLSAKDDNARKEGQKMLVQLLLSDARKYPADLVEAFMQLEGQVWGATKRTYNAECSLSGTSMPISIPDKPELFAQQQALLQRMANTPVDAGSTDEKVRNAALVDMWQLWALMLADLSFNTYDVIRGFCREPGRYYKILLAQPASERLDLFRSIATVQTADARLSN